MSDKKKCCSILNLCGGKIIPPIPDLKVPTFLLNLDQIYFNDSSIREIAECHNKFVTADFVYSGNKTLYLNHDAYDFLNRYNIPFDIITIYRFLEHVPKSSVLYFIYLLSTCTIKGSIIDIIVPDYQILAERIIAENTESLNFESEDIITTYELLNDMPSPHLSIWTVNRIRHFFELEGRFILKETTENFKFDGRDIYLRAKVERL